MKHIKKTDPEYKYYVDDIDKTAYDIYAERLVKNQQIVCPHDSDMFVRKNDDGTISIIKRSYLKSIFSKKDGSQSDTKPVK